MKSGKRDADEGRAKLLSMAIHPVTRAYALPALQEYRPDLIEEFHEYANAADKVMGIYFGVEKSLQDQRRELGIGRAE